MCVYIYIYINLYKIFFGKTVAKAESPNLLTWLLRNLYAGQEATVRTGHEMTPNWERSTSRVYVVTLFI